MARPDLSQALPKEKRKYLKKIPVNLAKWGENRDEVFSLEQELQQNITKMALPQPSRLEDSALAPQIDLPS